MIFTLANVGLPGTSGFVGEFLTLVGAFKADTLVAFLATIGVILSAAYALYLYRRVVFGSLVKPTLQNITDLDMREMVALGPLIAATIYFGVYPMPVFDATSPAVKRLLEQHQQSIAVGSPEQPLR
jgi:NADH-quinone oxidoreductase subunit M